MMLEIYLLWERMLLSQIDGLAAIERAGLLPAAECQQRRARLGSELAELRARL